MIKKSPAKRDNIEVCFSGPPHVRGCCRFSGFTTTAYPWRVQGEGWGGDGVVYTMKNIPIPHLASPLKGEEQDKLALSAYGNDRLWTARI